VAQIGDLRLIHAWSRATEDDEALVFVDIENHGTTEIMLTGGQTPLARSVEVVGFQLQGARGVYVPLGDLPIAAGSKMALTPEGVALRLDGLSQPLHQGDTFPMEIEVGHTHADVVVQIEAANARQHSHAGHQH